MRKMSPLNRSVILGLGLGVSLVSIAFAPGSLRAQDAAVGGGGGSVGSSASSASSGYATQPPVQATQSSGPSEPNLAPTGERFQGKRFRTSVDVRAGYDTNVYTTSEDSENEESQYAGITGAFTYNFGNQRTQLSLGGHAGVDFYFDVTDDDTFYSFGLNFGVTHSFTPRFTMGFSTSTAYQSQPDFSIAIASTRQSGDYFYSSNRVFGTYLWSPKFQTVTGYTLGTIMYEDANIAETGDRFEHTFNQEFRYLWTPVSTLIAEYRYGFASYQEDQGDDNKSHYALLGVDHQLGPRSSITSRFGAQFTDYDSENSEDSTVPYAELVYNYRAGERTSIAWYNRLGIEQSELGSANERYTYRTGLTASHGLTAKLNGNIGAYYAHDEYSGTGEDFSEDSVDFSTSLEYLFSRLFSASLGYQYSGVLGSTSDRDYDRNKLFLSLRASF
jgi:hypothetical protein